jgi:hypothetical protein
MSKLIVTEKLINKFLKLVTAEYVSKYGHSLGNIDEYKVFLTKVYHNTEFVISEGKTDYPQTSLMFKELISKGYAKQNNTYYTLTQEGLTEGFKLLNPIKSFLKTHWKWVIATFIAIVAISLKTLQ